MHSKECKYHSDNYDESLVTVPENERLSNYIQSGQTVSDIKPRKGFEETKTIAETTTLNHSENEGTLKKRTRSKKSNVKERNVNYHLSTLEEHVVVWKNDENFEIIGSSTNKSIPIKYMFKTMRSNVLYRNLDKVKYLNIFYGEAYLNSIPSHDSVLSITFKTSVTVDGIKYYPSLIISKEYIKEEYPDLYLEFINEGIDVFKVYTTLLLYINADKERTYLNFSSFKKETQVNRFDSELFSNLYIE